ncbi:MAG: hypothetical protein CBC35_01730 [Planctomycetes bacterium TMED75]|nr:succinate-semialdehyde dehydrogenase (NADP(+)) [Planctomycetaceae bacterium]OUU96277.1 MAG: hypothetical protein CBC35_01730 [Planctomycetes bacterium TMED75]
MAYRNFIDGDWVDSDSGRTFAVLNPADNALVGEVPDCGASEASRAIKAAAAARLGFQQLERSDRTHLLRELSEQMHVRRLELSDLLTAEQGKPRAESEGEIAYARSYLDGAAREADQLPLEQPLDPAETGKNVIVRPTSMGVVGIITPWNFPLAMLAKKIGPAFAQGCPVVVKPAEDTPLTTLLLARLCEEVGIPRGVFNVVTGDPSLIGAEFMSNRDVRMVSFTGSTATGRILIDGASRNFTRLLLELGGHAPFIVTEDADLDDAVSGLIASKFRNNGQTCVCPNRILVPEAFEKRFVALLEAGMRQLVCGRGDRAGVDLGPLINDRAIESVEAQVEDALSRGATRVLGGHRLKFEGLADRFYAPTLLTGCTSQMDCFKTETFGPVCPVRSYRSIDEAVEIANELPCGLAGYVWCGDTERGLSLAQRLECGIVGINDAAPVTASTPFGGVRESGWGQEGGEVVLHEYAPTRTYSIGGSL